MSLLSSRGVPIYKAATLAFRKSIYHDWNYPAETTTVSLFSLKCHNYLRYDFFFFQKRGNLHINTKISSLDPGCREQHFKHCVRSFSAFTGAVVDHRISWLTEILPPLQPIALQFAAYEIIFNPIILYLNDNKRLKADWRAPAHIHMMKNKMSRPSCRKGML